MLTRYAGKVYLVVPAKKLKFDVDPGEIEKKGLEIVSASIVKEIFGNEVVEGVRLEDISTGQLREVPLEGVFVYLHGSKPVVDFLNFAVDISDEECVITNRMMETNIPGIFAAGDVTCVEVRQVVIAAANGCVAALSADKYLHHRKRRKYDWAKSR